MALVVGGHQLGHYWKKGWFMLQLYPIYEYHIAATQLALVMVGMGAVMTVKEFENIFRSPRPLIIGIACQLIVVPAIAYLAIKIFNLHPGISIGIILVAAVPGGTLSNLYTYLGKGNAALSISLTCLSTLACLFTTPIILKIMASQLLPPNFSMPVFHIIRDISLFLLIPLAIGMLIGNKFPKMKNHLSKWCIRCSLFLIVVIVVGALGSGRIDIMEYGIAMPVYITSFTITIAVVSLLISYLMKFSSKDGFAIGIEVFVRNTNLALLIGVSLFPASGEIDPIVSAGVVYTALYYGGNNLLAPIIPLLVHRRIART